MQELVTLVRAKATLGALWGPPTAVLNGPTLADRANVGRPGQRWQTGPLINKSKSVQNDKNEHSRTRKSRRVLGRGHFGVHFPVTILDKKVKNKSRKRPRTARLRSLSDKSAPHLVVFLK